MKTASIKTYFGPGRISIARSVRGAAPGFRVFSPLAPGPWFNSVSRAEYERRFADEILARLDPLRTWNVLHTLTLGGAEPILMCHEAPPFTPIIWCHRRIVSQWFKDTIGHDVEELESTPRQGDLFG